METFADAMMAEPLPPFRARLHRYVITPLEFCLLSAMLEQCSDGSKVYASIERLSAYSKLSKRTCQRLISNLRQRGIITRTAPATNRWPVTYRINEEAFDDDPKMLVYRMTVRNRNEKNTKCHADVTGDLQTPQGCQLVASGVTNGRAGGVQQSPNPKALIQERFIQNLDSTSGEFDFDKRFGEPCFNCRGDGWVASLSKPGRVVRCNVCARAYESA